MLNPVLKASSPNGSLFGAKMNIVVVLLAACLLLQCGASSFVNQDDNDLVFEDGDLQLIRDQNPTNSSQIDSKYSNVVSLDNDILINTRDDRKSNEEPLSERISQRFDRFKRQAFDILGGLSSFFGVPTKKADSDATSTDPTAESNTPSTTRRKRSSVKTTRSRRQGDSDPDSDNSLEDDDAEPDTSTEEDGVDPEDTSDPSFSGVPTTTFSTQPSSVQPSKSHFRVFIKLLEPYTYEFNNHSSVIFKDYESNITTSIRQILAVPDFVSARLVAIVLTTEISQSKAIVDLEFSGAESKERIKSSLSPHLASELKLGSLGASPVDLYIRDFSGSIPYTECPSLEIPCKDSDACYPALGRCDGNNECPDHSDEDDCPLLDRCRSDDKFICTPNTPNTVIVCGVNKCDGKQDCPGGEDEPSTCENNSKQACLDSEFFCDSICNPISKRCNGIDDCDDRTDEKDCPTPSPPSPPTPPPIPPIRECQDGEFLCDESLCIPNAGVCNGFPDCRDGTDESKCKPQTTPPTTSSSTTTQTPPPEPICNNATEFKCKSGQCIAIKGRCDNLTQCYDKSDEENCDIGFTTPITSTSTSTTTLNPSTGCRPDQITCYDGACIEGSQRCDKVRDCSQGEDEGGCPTDPTTPPPPLPAECSSSEFKCGDGSCIDISRKCNRQVDCSDGSDENGCSSICLSSEFRCNDGHCIPSARRCDRYPDCRDGTDELECQICEPNEFQCDDRHCIPSGRKCDGFADCRDASDEFNCPTTTTPTPSRCAYDEYRCFDGHCIPNQRRCDGFADCRDSSDEYGCGTTTSTTEYPGCRPDQFTCVYTRQCVPSWARCNNRTECFDRSDESNCPVESNEFLNLRAYPTDQIIKASQEVVFQCRDEGPLRSEVTWTRGNGLPLPVNSIVSSQGRLEIPNIQVSHSGTYICKAVEPYSRYPGSEITVHLTVEPFVAITAKPIQPCAYDESTCLNGDCVRKEFICNGRFDCADGSDEMRCKEECEPDQFRCQNKMCVQKNWLCDGEDDCKDGSDERNCAPTPPGSPCRYDEFQCTGNGTKQCVQKAFQCDGQNDCFDGTDEVGCSKVFIVQPPPPMIHLNEGDTFNITCTAVGVPTPEVVWRRNWGHVPSECISTSVNGVGTLTCYDIQAGEGGSYSCEGINSKGFVVATPDCVLIITAIKPPGCPVGQFNDLALTPNECIGCFCFGVTSSCQGANLFTFELLPPLYERQISYVSVSYNSAFSEIDFNTNDVLSLRTSILSSNSFQVKGFFDPNQSTHPYLSFLSIFNGNQLKSYGGYIKYNIRYDPAGSFLDTPLIIISGNGNKIFYNGTQYFANNGTQLISTQSEQVSAHIFYGAWFKEGSGSPGGGDLPSIIKPTLASREDIMMILVNVDQIVLKLQYTDSRVVDTTISNFRIDSAAATNVGLGKAAYVEQCSCPPGYSGLSCESCASGYSRLEGNWLGRCQRIETCVPGTFGDPLRGIPCQACPCPSSNPTNQFGRTCLRDTDGQPTCQCPPGYIGRRCERCAPGYTGNPLVPGDYCKPIRSACNPYGSTELSTGPPCNCKPFTTGYYCDQCKSSAFYLAPSNPYGCISCFCMGVTTACTSSSWYRQVVTTTFVRSTEDFKIVRRQDIQRAITDEIEVRPNEREIIYSSFSPTDQSVYYWLLPQRYLGDKTTSYGGVLNYTIRYVPTQGGQPSRNNAPDVEIVSNNEIRLFYFKKDGPLQPNALETVSVPLFEQDWQREDGQPADREHLLMALADLNAILIKATYTTTTAEVGLQSVSLEIAEERNTGLRPAYEVEECRCPAGYRGLSCQECDAGYTRLDQGLYLGLCVRCSCFGHSEDCDADTGVCLNCGNHTTGPDCSQCEPGYTGDPRSGQACYPIDTGCYCDPRGSLQSGCINGRCTCKTNVVGDNCATCRSGTFDLQDFHRTGCLECWCSGVSSQCQSSNLFVVQIPMPILDNNHGFTLSQSDRRPFINPRFELDISQNQIGFDYTIARGQRLYWSLPPKFTGNKLSSYGGNLTWTQGYAAPFDAVSLDDVDLIIYGDGTSLFWSSGVTLPLNTTVTRSVKLEENEFIRVTASGSQKASRADILRVLSSIEAILIRATFRSQTSYIHISDVSMDAAVGQQLSSVRATQVEACRCPPGYRGLSCESCQNGYYSDEFNGRGKECRKCPCNGREESCSIGANAQVVCKCAPGFSGANCEGIAGQDQSTPSFQVSSSTDPNAQQPTIFVTIREPTIQIVALGSTLRYNCRAQSIYNLPVVVKWSKEEGILPPARSVDDGNGNLVLINAAASDSGTYVCTAYDSRAYVSQRVYVTVGVPAAPKVSLVPSGSATLYAGESLSVSCEASGIPPPTVEFGRLSGTPINKKSALKSTVFTIPFVKKSDEGSYYCRANNSAGYDLQQINIYVNEIPTQVVPIPSDVRVTIEPREFIGSSGEPIRLQCSVSSDTLDKTKWTRYPNLPLQSGANENNGLLYIYTATPQDSGIYVCTLTSEQTGAILSQAEVSVNIGPSRRPPALLTIEPERQTVAQGTLAKIKCLVSDDSNARVTWRKANENLPTYAQIIGNELQIPQVDIKDRGIYVCELNYADGNPVQVHSVLEVQRREAPSVEIYPKDKQTVFASGTALLQCRTIRGEPSPTLHWSRSNNRPLSAHVEVLEGGVLRFTNITEEDEGQYICTAQNLVGSVTTIASLEVLSPPIITLNPRGPYYVPLGQRVRIECTARGKPQPSVVWQDTTTNYVSIDGTRAFTTRIPQTAVFEINRAQLSDSKIYTCIAENAAGRVEETIQVVITPDQNNDINPFPPNQNPNGGVFSSIAPDEEIIFPLGTTANLRCNVGSSSSYYNIQWIRDGGNLPDNHRIYNGDLILYSISRSNAGKYTCLGVGADNEVLFTKSINLRVTGGPPRISLNPVIQTVRPGDNAVVECTAEGDQPIAIQWATKTGAPFTRSVSSNEGRLIFRGITINDAGQYVCTARNIGGEAEAVAEVQVSEINRPTRPIIKAQERIQNTYEGSDLDLKCVVDFPSISTQVTWRREHGALPRTSQIFGDTLRLINIRAEDADRYICEISSRYGVGSDYIDVQVERISNVSLSIEASKDPIKIGDMVSLLCNVIGDADGNVIWSKGDGDFEQNVYIDKSVLRIADVQPANRGIYRCSTYANGGLRSADYRIEVQLGELIIPTAVDTKTAKYGENIDLNCAVDLEPPVNYSWIVHSYDKSLRRIVNSDKISVQNLTVNESGLYTCSASNGKTTLNIPRVLVVTDVIPAFSKNSYLTLRPLINAENHFQIEITFKPKSDTGLILYTGQKNDGTGDYVSFGLNYGVPEFRFDVGSGPAIIRGQTQLRMNTWHTVRLVRDKREGFMEINKRENRTGSSPGSFERLDLQFPLFIGGLPTDTAYNNSGFVSGFEGCVNRLMINNREANLKKEMIGANNLEDCDNCRDNPCQHGGVCQQTLTAGGYTCVCLPGHSGENCELTKDICYLDSCGTGKCVEHENGIDCQCPLGKTGKKCEKSITIETPAFLKNSWLAYQAPLLKKKFKLLITLKPVGESYVDDGLIFYIAENENGSGDYISLSISNSFAELKFKILSRDVVLRSGHYLAPNEEVLVNITMSAAQAIFSVGNDPGVAEEFNPRAESAELKLSTPLYVGGYDKNITKLPEDLLVRNGFHGCISMLDVSGTSIKMLQSSITTTNVNDCYQSFGDICRSKMPCQNNGICKTTRDTYKCECAFSYSGTNCERQKDMCEIMNYPCQNNAKCVGTSNSLKCNCDLGFIGEHCENRVSIDENIRLNGDGFVELSGSLLPHRSTYDINILIYFTTRANEGLLLWHGQHENVNGKDYDYVAIGIINGYVELSYKSGDNERVLRATDHKVNDGKEHIIRAVRRKETVQFELDSSTSELATLESIFNINGNIFVGGSPNTLMTGNLYRRGFVGCINLLSIQNNRAINFGTEATSARNVAQCSSSSYQDSNAIN